MYLLFYDDGGNLSGTTMMLALRDYAHADLIAPFLGIEWVLTNDELHQYANAMDSWIKSQPPKDFPLHDMMWYESDMDLVEWLLLVRSCYIDYLTKNWGQFFPSWRRLQEQMPRLGAAALNTDLTNYVIEKAKIIREAATSGKYARWSSDQFSDSHPPAVATDSPSESDC
jgi:hypothetical protein